MKIGILTYHHANNYGAYLQACALSNRLNEVAGIDAEVIDFYMYKEVEKYDFKKYKIKTKLKMLLTGTYFFNRNKYRAFSRAHKSGFMNKSNETMVSDSISDFQNFVKNKYDIIVAGSDEIWKVNAFRGFPTAYWLIGDLGCKKASYAASSRVHFDDYLDSDQIEIIKNSLNEFSFIGVRDLITKKEIDGLLGKDVCKLCCDPSFLYKFELPRTSVKVFLEKPASLKDGKQNIVVMLDDKDVADHIYRALGEKYNLIAVFTKFNHFYNVSDLDPIEWLTLISNADFVITSFFHATCYSIIYEVPFLSIATEGKASKLSDLLKDSNLSDRLVMKSGDKYTDLTNAVSSSMNTDGFASFVDNQRKTFSEFLDWLKMIQG